MNYILIKVLDLLSTVIKGLLDMSQTYLAKFDRPGVPFGESFPILDRPNHRLIDFRDDRYIS